MRKTGPYFLKRSFQVGFLAGISGGGGGRMEEGGEEGEEEEGGVAEKARSWC